MKKKMPMTLDDHNAALSTNLEYQKVKRDQDLAMAEQTNRLQTDAIPLIRDLKSIGYDVKSAWDLVNTSTPYPTAIPVLIKHLAEPYLDRNLEAIARSLAVQEAAYAWPILLEHYKRAPFDSGKKFGLGIALSVIAKEKDFDDLLQLIDDKRNGESRLPIIYAAWKKKTPLTSKLIEKACEDPELAKVISLW